MNTTYNPLREAAKVAIAEMTSEQAQQYYSLKAQQDMQTAMDTALTVMQMAYLTCRFIYDLGYLTGELHHAAIAAIVEANKPKPFSLYGFQPVGLLSATTQKLQRLPSRVGPSATPVVTVPPADMLNKLTVRQLQAICRKTGLGPFSKLKKAELIAMISG